MAGRISQVVKEARPFTGALYATYTTAEHANRAGPRESKKGHTQCWRFKTAASWLLLLVAGTDKAFFPLRQLVTHSPRPKASVDGTVFQVDASPWGGGAILIVNGVVKEYWWYVWNNRDAAHLQVRTALPAHQTFWEALSLLISMMVWKAHFKDGNVVLVIGDNVPSLQNTLDLKGKRSLMAISREIAWRRARFGWQYDVGHLPSEHNIAPDCLSRQAGPDPKPWPSAELAGAVDILPPAIVDIWKVR